MKICFRMNGLDCANCASKLERKIVKVSGVRDVSVNFMTLKLSLEIDDSNSENVLCDVENVIAKNMPKLIIKRC